MVPGRLILQLVRRLQRRFAACRVLVVGDSHAKIFNNYRFLALLPRIHLHVVAKGGATASGLATPNSKTQAYKIFRQALDTVERDVTMVQLGEVDTGYVIWYRARKHQASVEEMFQRAVTTYANFLREVAAAGPVLVVSAPLPTISDDNDWGVVADLRKEVKTSQRERTDLTIAFNREMERFCRENKMWYLNLDAECLGPDGIVRPYYMNPNPLDHHYHKGRYVRLMARRLRPLLAEIKR